MLHTGGGIILSHIMDRKNSGVQPVVSGCYRLKCAQAGIPDTATWVSMKLGTYIVDLRVQN